jgi:PDZ-binding kinase
LDTDGAIDTDEGEYVGTSCWAAPEVVHSDGLTPITSKADIFSFGLILWEMMTLRMPHFDESSIAEVDTSELAEEDGPINASVMSVTDTSVCSTIGVKYGKCVLSQEVYY